MAFGPPLPSHNPAEAKARSIQRQLEAKRASRAYDQHCRSCGMNPIEAQLLAPPNVKRGKALRNMEERHRQKEAFHAKKEKLQRKFQSGSA